MATVTEVVDLPLLLLIHLHRMHPLRQLRRTETNALAQLLRLRPLEVPSSLMGRKVFVRDTRVATALWILM